MQKLVPALNAHLPPDIRAVDIRPVPDSFHARYAAHAKTYHYYLLNTRWMIPFCLTPATGSGLRWIWPPCRRLPQNS